MLSCACARTTRGCECDSQDTAATQSGEVVLRRRARSDKHESAAASAAVNDDSDTDDKAVSSARRPAPMRTQSSRMCYRMLAFVVAIASIVLAAVVLVTAK
jgi:hypothetical protein